MPVQFLVEREEAGEVAALRVDRGRRLAGDLGHEVHPRKREQAVPPLSQEPRNVMLLIICRNKRAAGHVFRTSPSRSMRVFRHIRAIKCQIDVRHLFASCQGNSSVKGDNFSPDDIRRSPLPPGL